MGAAKVILTDALAATTLRGQDGEQALVRVDPAPPVCS
jgi:hypothetical protein